MRFELPEFKRCCFCVPLRYGLIVWTYIKLIFVIPMIVMISTTLWSLTHSVEGSYSALPEEIAVNVVVVLYLIMDVIFGIIFLIGGHMKNPKLLKIEFYQSLVALGLFTLFSVGLVGLIIAQRFSRRFYYFNVYVAMAQMSVLVGIIVIKIYIILLTRSEIDKLTNNFGFRFVNNAADVDEVEVVVHETKHPLNEDTTRNNDEI